MYLTSFYAGHEGAKKKYDIIKLWRLTLVTMSVLFFGGQSLDVKRISKGGQRCSTINLLDMRDELVFLGGFYEPQFETGEHHNLQAALIS